MDCIKNNCKTCYKVFSEKNIGFFFFYEDVSRRLPITYYVKTKETWLRKKLSTQSISDRFFEAVQPFYQ